MATPAASYDPQQGEYMSEAERRLAENQVSRPIFLYPIAMEFQALTEHVVPIGCLTAGRTS
eukprot:2372119-Rhodomonas_salina.2